MRPGEHRCPIQAMTYDRRGATCTACGLRWPFTYTSDGKPLGYLTPPYVPAKRAESMRGWWE